MNKPRVSVVMNTYHDPKPLLVRAMKSYKNQRDVDVQLIISTVADDEQAQDLACLNGCSCAISLEPGIFGQLNHAINFVDSGFFTYASGNDYAMPHKLIHEVTALNGKSGVCYSDFWYNAPGGRRSLFHKYDYDKHLKGNFVSDCAMCTTDLLRKYGPFKKEWGNDAYYDLWLRIAEGEGPGVFTYNPVPEWVYCITKESRHVRRKGDPAWKKRNRKLRQALLAWHRSLAK